MPALESLHDELAAGLEVVPLAYDALGAPSKTAREFLGRVIDSLPSCRQASMSKFASLVLGVALARSTASILMERAGAAVAADEADEPLDMLDWFLDDDLEWSCNVYDTH